MSEHEDYWRGYRAALQDLSVALASWTPTGDVEGLEALIQERLDGLDPPDPDPIPFQTLERARATDPHGGRGKDGPFPTATSYAALPLDGRVRIIKAGLPEDIFEPDQAEVFASLLQRCAARARMPDTPT